MKQIATWMLLFAMGLPAAAVAQAPATPTITVSPKTVRVAEPIRVTLSVTANSNTEVSFPAWAEQWGQLELVDHRSPEEIPQPNGLRTWQQTLTLESLSPGVLPLPPVEITLTRDGSSEVVRTESQTVNVTSVLETSSDPTRIRDIKGAVEIEPTKRAGTSWLLWSSLASLAAVVAAAITWLVLRKRTRPNAGRWALDQLEALQQQLASGQLNPDDALFGTEKTLRQYLEIEAEIPAMTLTGEELVEALGSLNPPPTVSPEPLQAVLAASDNAKYGGHRPTNSAVNALLDQAIGWVKNVASQMTQEAR